MTVPASARVPEPAPACIYVVDDDALAVESIGRLLELETPHRIRTFRSAVDALDAIRVESPDLLITDLSMPTVDGIALLRQARKLHPGGARMLLTGYADKESAIRAINSAGIYQIIEKPWDNAQLLVAIAHALDHVELTRQLNATVAELRSRNSELEQTIQELHDAQDRLVSAERLAAVGRVAGGIAHELGNQLSLLGYAEILADKYPDATELTTPLLAARRRLGVMVTQIRDFVRGSGQRAYPRESQPLAPIFDEALSIMRFEAALKLRQIVREPNDPEARASVNGEKILQVVLNLIRNALQATQEGGRIRLGVARRNERVILEVEDDGHGIPPGNLARIWEPFFSTKGDAGTGLGLGICRRIIEEHDGTISVESSPEHGARFTIDLPAT